MAEAPQMQPLEFNDFSGGMTDKWINGPRNCFRSADNMYIREDGRALCTRPGSEIYDATNYVLPGGANGRGSALINHEGQLFQTRGKNIYTVVGGSWTTLLGPSSNTAYTAGTNASFVSFARWNKHLITTNDAPSKVMRVYQDGGTGNWTVRNLGLPALATAPTCTPVAGSGTYIYAFVYTVSYTIGSVTFQEISATKLVQVASAAAPNVSAIAITAIPSVSNGAGDNYDTSNIKVSIYRTIDAGTTLYYVGQVNNGTTTYNDTASDATIQNAATLYTSGGVLDYDQPPECKYVVEAGGIVYYLHCKEGSQTLTNRVRQANPGAPYQAPASATTDLDDEITGGGAIGRYAIVFCKTRVYRLAGAYTSTGQGSIQKVELSRTVGCVSHRSIIPVTDGLLFAAEDGFYFTDGNSVRKISDLINDTYKSIVATATQASRIYGAYDQIEAKAYWACQRDQGSADCDSIAVLHLKAGIKPDMPFTFWSGGSFDDNFQPSSLIFFGQQLLRGDRRGYLFRHANSLFTDPVIDTTALPSAWATTAIIYDYRSVSTDFGSTKVRKWVPKITLSADNAANLSMTIFGENDQSGTLKELKEVRYRGNLTWQDSSLVWGSNEMIWNYTPTIGVWRWFPASGGLRCLYKSTRMTNSFTDIDYSDALATADVNGTTKQVTLTGSGKVWIPDVVGYSISFEVDSYQRQYLITARNSGTVITVQDLDGALLTQSGAKWQIKGYRKGDILTILSWAYEYGMLTTTQQPYRGPYGGNA